MKIIRLHEQDKVPASHEDLKDPGVLKQILLRQTDLMAGRLQMINWSTLLPGKSFRRHYHEAMDEVFIILDGEVEMTLGDEKARLGRGDTVVIPEKMVHVMKNLTDRAVCYIALGISRDQGGKTVVV